MYLIKLYSLYIFPCLLYSWTLKIDLFSEYGKTSSLCDWATKLFEWLAQMMNEMAKSLQFFTWFGKSICVKTSTTLGEKHSCKEQAKHGLKKTSTVKIRKQQPPLGCYPVRLYTTLTTTRCQHQQTIPNNWWKSSSGLHSKRLLLVQKISINYLLTNKIVV